MFHKCNIRKSAGPDVITGKFLKSLCVSVMWYFYWSSLTQHKVLKLWKESIVVPVTKNKSPKELNDPRPVALTSLVMKTFERLVKQILTDKVQGLLDPMQFAYRVNRRVDDATTTLFNYLYKYLEGTKTNVRLSFVDFSAAFDTIQPHCILASKLLSTFNLGTVIDKNLNHDLNTSAFCKKSLQRLSAQTKYF